MNQKLKSEKRIAFTLIELLVVIAIIGILAALIFPILAAVNSAKIRSRTSAELAQLVAAIGNYKTKLGHYPPDNPGNPATNQLFYELMGTTNDGLRYMTRDLNVATAIPAGAVQAAFGPAVSGFVNSGKGGGGDEGGRAEQFLPNIKPNQMAKGPTGATLLVGVPWQPGPAPFDFQPLGARAPGLNPWRYNSSNPTNNPGSYDLWIEVRIGSKTFLVCNWNPKPLAITVHDPY